MDRRKDKPGEGAVGETQEGCGESPEGGRGFDQESDQAPPVGPQWKKVDRLGIHDRVEDVLRKTIEATKLQLEHERKKLRKLKYGS